MEIEFSTTVWGWYAEDEYKKLLSFCELCSGLEFLAVEAEAQSISTPSCPGCEVWNEKMLCIQEFIDGLGNSLKSSWDSCLSYAKTLAIKPITVMISLCSTIKSGSH